MLSTAAVFFGALGSGTLAMREPTTLGARESSVGYSHCLQSGVLATQCHTARGSGRRNSCNVLPPCLGHWAVELLQIMPHCLGAGGSAPPIMHYLTT